MNESSSKFVDQFALDKLLNEKLSKVTHSPNGSLFREEENFFAPLEAAEFDPKTLIIMGDDHSHQILKVPSPNQGPYPENNSVYLHFYPAAKACGNILLVHGLFDDNLINYNFLTQLLKEAGFNIFILILPYHYERRPETSLFSGEYFWSADLYRSQHAAKQAVFDLKISVGLVSYLAPLPTLITGFSMGGCISLRYFTLENKVAGLFLINPVTRLSQLIWESPLLHTVQKDLETAGFDPERAQSYFQILDPMISIGPDLPSDRIALGYSIYDQVIQGWTYQEFIDRYGLKNTLSYHAGHLNVLRVPKLPIDITQFFHSIVD
ncbi:MAG: alpha/beta hydrolase [Firmicutes bacterium]|nr:alpha/beta hydrolase [Bacillota bacterium]